MTTPILYKDIDYWLVRYSVIVTSSSYLSYAFFINSIYLISNLSFFTSFHFSMKQRFNRTYVTFTKVHYTLCTHPAKLQSRFSAAGAMSISIFYEWRFPKIFKHIHITNNSNIQKHGRYCFPPSFSIHLCKDRD